MKYRLVKLSANVAYRNEFAKKTRGTSGGQLNFCYICCMKSRYLYIIFIILSQVTVIMQAQAGGWPKVYQPFDSIATILDNSDELVITVEDFDHKVSEMEAMVGKEGPHHAPLLWRSMYWRACSLMRTDRDKAQQLITQALASVDTIGFRYDYMRLLSLAHSYDLYQIDNALQDYIVTQKIIQYAEEIKDTLLLASSIAEQGILISNLGDGKRGVDYFTRATNLYKAMGRTKKYQSNRMNLALAYGNLGQKDSALAILKDVLDYARINKDLDQLTRILVNLVNFETDSIEQKKYADEAYEAACYLGYPVVLAMSRVNKGAAFMETSPDSALYYYELNWEFLQHFTDYNSILPTLGGLMESNARLGRYEEAWKYTKLYGQYNDSINQQAIIISNLEQLHAIDQYEQNLAQEKELARTRNIIFYLTAALLSLLVIGLGYIIVLQRRQNRLKEQNRQLELDAKNRELTAHELKSIEKNRMLEELEKRISEGREQGEIDRQAAMELRSQINAHVKHENEWQNFQVQFEQVYPDFYRTLKAIAPSLTEGELRLCAYIRTGMDNKQIASMLSQQPDSVKKSRYRLRKKLPLTTDDSLEDFLRNL